jgi:hypothetical protein
MISSPFLPDDYPHLLESLKREFASLACVQRWRSTKKRIERINTKIHVRQRRRGITRDHKTTRDALLPAIAHQDSDAAKSPSRIIPRERGALGRSPPA